MLSRTHFGKYLFTKRTATSPGSLSAFLLKAKLPISASYYRDLEAGRKTLPLSASPSAGTVEALCKALKVDKTEFHYHILEDLLPTDVFKTLVRPMHQHTFDDASDEIRRLESTVARLRKAHSKIISDDPYEVSDDVVDFLNNNTDLLPVIHFVYMRKLCTFNELALLLKKNKSKRSLKSTLEALKNHNLALVDQNACTVKRYKTTFRIPKTARGKAFKDIFTLTEVKQSLQSPKGPILSRKGTFIHSGINCFNMDRDLSALEEKVTDLVATFSAEETDLEEASALPFFVSIIISPRESYDSRDFNNNPTTPKKESLK